MLTEGTTAARVAAGAPIVIVLQSNPSTGSSWQVRTAPDPRVARIDGTTFIDGAQLDAPPTPAPPGAPPLPPMVGRPGIALWHVTTLQPGFATLAFTLRGPSGPWRTATFSITAVPPTSSC